MMMKGCFLARCGCPDDQYSDASWIYWMRSPCYCWIPFVSSSTSSFSGCATSRFLLLVSPRYERESRVWDPGGFVLRRVTIRRELRKNFLFLIRLAGNVESAVCMLTSTLCYYVTSGSSSLFNHLFALGLSSTNNVCRCLSDSNIFPGTN